MTGTPQMPEDGPRRIASPTTVLLARRMLASAEVVAACMPTGYGSSPGLLILLSAFVAQDADEHLRIEDIVPARGVSRPTTERWLRELIQRGHVDRRAGVVELTSQGFDRMTCLLQSVSDAERRLDQSLE